MDFIFEPPHLFEDLVAGFFLFFLWDKVLRKNRVGEPLAKSSKFDTTKIPDTSLQRGRAKM